MFDKSVIYLIRLVLILAAMVGSFFVGKQLGSAQTEVEQQEAIIKEERELNAKYNEIESERCSSRDCVIAGMLDDINN